MTNKKEIVMNAIAKAKADWVKSMVEDFNADEKKNPLNIGAIGVGNTIIVAYAEDVDAPLVGVAKCNPTDTYDRELGIAIAYARAIGEDIPDYVLDSDISLDEDDDDYDDDDYDDDYDDDEDDENSYVEFSEISIGTKFIDDDELYIKISEDKAYRYADRKTIDFGGSYEVDEVIED